MRVKVLNHHLKKPERTFNKERSQKKNKKKKRRKRSYALTA